MAEILVIDDEPLVCTLLQIVLTRHGHEVRMAYNGREGIESFRRNRPRFTFLDLYLPDMTGIEVLRQIRRIDPEGAVLILTAARSREMEQQARELGVTDYLIKGLPVEALIGAVRQATLEPLQPAGGADSGQCSILLVDDDPTIRLWLSEALTQRGHRVRTAQSGQAALDLVEADRPHLIVLDMHMPGMSGVEVLRRLRARNYTGATMMLTGSQEDALLKEALNLGAVDIVSKTADPERMILAIEARLIFTKR
jgi:DNA-binding response OmpR family regulator